MKEIIKEIEKSNSVLLHCHPHPDPDSVGSTLAMKFALEQKGKKVTLIKGDSDIPKAFDFPGVENIVKKNFFEIDLKDFDTFLILDCGGIEMVSKKSKVVFPDTLNTIVVDHHASNKGYGKYNYIEPKYSSTCELLYHLLQEMNVEINHDIALNLFMGMYTDTGGFRYGANGSETLAIASKLAMIAPDYQETISTMENSNRKESLIFESLALSSLKTLFDGKLAIASVPYEDLVKNNIKEEDIMAGYISNKIKSVKGTEIGVTLIESEKGKVKISLRSTKYDISVIATALGGGGHKSAAGAILESTTEAAIEKVVKTIKEIYNL